MISDREEQVGEERAIRVRCLDLEGEFEDTLVYAGSIESAVLQVRSEGLFPCEPISLDAAPALTKSASQPIADAVLLRWLRSMRGLVAVGNVKEQILRSSENVGDRRLKATIKRMVVLIGDGVTHLDELMARCRRDFPAWMIGSIRIARTNAKLREGIDRVTIILARNERQRRGRKMMMMQPRLLSFLLVALLVVLGIFLVPSLEHFTEKMCIGQPWQVKALFSLAKLPLNPLGDLAIVAGVLTARAAFAALLRTEQGALLYDRFLKSLPGSGLLDRMDAESQIARSLAFLFAVGAPRSRIMSMLLEAAPSPMYVVVLREIEAYYTQADRSRLTPAFQRSGEFSSTFIHHLSSAEKTTPTEGSSLMDGCGDELDADIETSREEATHKLTMRILYFFVTAIGAVILTVIPYSFQILTSYANNPAGCSH